VSGSARAIFLTRGSINQGIACCRGGGSGRSEPTAVLDWCVVAMCCCAEDVFEVVVAVDDDDVDDDDVEDISW